MKRPGPAPINRTTLHRAVLGWFARRGRKLPWRHIRDPYRILLSEIMLQQTQVSRVLVKFPDFIRRFPTLSALAKAQQSEVVVAWRGMGYNNRAVRLHRLARMLVADFGGKIPSNLDDLMGLPGIGEYTAHALLSAVHGVDAPVVDVNVSRVLSRLAWQLRSTAEIRPPRLTWDLARRLLPPGRAYEWNQALMDIGATLCRPRHPDCNACPVRSFCRSRISMRPGAQERGRREPSHRGTPNRIYRGRIIEELRTIGTLRSIRGDLLGRRIDRKFSTRDERWLSTLLEGLRRDGLVSLRGNGSVKSRRVSLA